MALIATEWSVGWPSISPPLHVMSAVLALVVDERRGSVSSGVGGLPVSHAPSARVRPTRMRWATGAAPGATQSPFLDCSRLIARPNVSPALRQQCDRLLRIFFNERRATVPTIEIAERSRGSR